MDDFQEYNIVNGDDKNSNNKPSNNSGNGNGCIIIVVFAIFLYFVVSLFR